MSGSLHVTDLSGSLSSLIRYPNISYVFLEGRITIVLGFIWKIIGVIEQIVSINNPRQNIRREIEQNWTKIESFDVFLDTFGCYY